MITEPITLDHPHTDDECRCVPCASPQGGYPTIAHCAACCSGSLIEEYDDHCPLPEHRLMAGIQFGRERSGA